MTANFPEVKQFILLIDERPEEVTDMRRNVKGEVCASSLDEDIESHVRLSQLVIERCKRLAEMGQDVFVLLDSITRLARAFNKYVGNKGEGIQTGGLGVRAMDIPKKLFATARAFEEGGSRHRRRHRAGRDQQPHGRRDLSGVQGHGQHGAGARPQAGRAAGLSGHRRVAVGHAPRGAAARSRTRCTP